LKLTLEDLKYLDRNQLSRKEFNRYLTRLQRQRVKRPIDEKEVLRLWNLLRKKSEP
jgi:hypothetical protein